MNYRQLANHRRVVGIRVLIDPTWPITDEYVGIRVLIDPVWEKPRNFVSQTRLSQSFFFFFEQTTQTTESNETLQRFLTKFTNNQNQTTKPNNKFEMASKRMTSKTESATERSKKLQDCRMLEWFVVEVPNKRGDA